MDRWHDAGQLQVLIVPGLHNSGPRHWQSRWETLYTGFERVHQTHWDQPDLPIWSHQLRHVLAQRKQPVLIVAHSFGCLTTVHQAIHDQSKIAGALLVAPADPAKFDVDQQLPKATLPFPSIVVGSTNDPWMSAEKTVQWAHIWGSEFVNVGALGHINADSDLGYWLFGLSLLQQLVRQAGQQLTVETPYNLTQ